MEDNYLKIVLLLKFFYLTRRQFCIDLSFLAKTIVVEFVESGNQRERDRGRGQLTMVCASNWD